MSNLSIVITRAGMAGARAAIALQAVDYQVSITMISEETNLTYRQPKLSKARRVEC